MELQFLGSDLGGTPATDRDPRYGFEGIAEPFELGFRVS